MKVTIMYHGVELECEGGYTKGHRAVPYFRNGDPGYPEEPPEFALESVKVGGVEIIEMLDGLFAEHYNVFTKAIRYGSVLADIEDICIEQIESEEDCE